MDKHKLAYSEPEWQLLCSGGNMTKVFINVSNLRARILAMQGDKYVDVTD